MADQPSKPPVPLPPAVAEKLATVGQRIEADSVKLENAALARVTVAYDQLYSVSPATGRASGALLAVIAQAEGAASLASPNARLAAVPDILTALDGVYSATVQTALDPDEKRRLRGIREIIGDAVHLGVKGTLEALETQAPAFAWDITPQRELTYLADSQARFMGYWAKESPRFRAEVQAVLEDGLRRGLGPRQIGKLLADRAGVSRSRAELIAADQVGNARADAMQATQHELGVTRYQWSATGGKRGDGRTRDLHKHLHGGVYEWGKPGPAENGGHPGQPIRCRCVALPYVADLLADAPTIAELDAAEKQTLTSDPFTVWLDEKARLEAEQAAAIEALKDISFTDPARDAAVLRWHRADAAIEAHNRARPADVLEIEKRGRLAAGETPADRLAKIAADQAAQGVALAARRSDGLALAQQLRAQAQAVRAGFTSPELAADVQKWAADQLPALEAEAARLEAIARAEYDGWALLAKAYTRDPSPANKKALDRADKIRKAASSAELQAMRAARRMRGAAEGNEQYLGELVSQRVRDQLKVKSSRVEITQLTAQKEKPTARIPKGGRGPDALAQAALRVKEYVDVDVKGELTVYGSTGRAFHRRGAVYLDWGDGDAVGIHEMGHWLEFRSPELADQAQKFLEYRAQGKPLRKMKKKYPRYRFKDTEIFYDGAFDWSAGGEPMAVLGDYAGKLYKDGNGQYYGTEIMSIGLQLFEENPVLLAKLDPEFFDFIYVTARGGLWF